MAKTADIPSPMTRTHRLHIDLPDKFDMKQITIGEEVTVVAKGRIKSASAGEPDKDYPFPPDMCIELQDITIKGRNIFEELDDED